MENASKALLIAGGVLITVLVITVGIAFRGKLGSVSESYVDELDLIEIQKYNAYFESYVGRSDITAREIITVLNIAQAKKIGTNVYIKKRWWPKESITDMDEEEKNKFLEDNLNYVIDDAGTMNITYKVDNSSFPIQYNDNGFITEITFIKNY